MSQDNPSIEFNIVPDTSETVTLTMPIDMLDMLRSVAENRQMTLHELLYAYVENGLENDLGRTVGGKIYESTEQMLQDYLDTPEEIDSILSDLREQVGSLSTEKAE